MSGEHPEDVKDLQELVRRHGGCVPNYTSTGEQHYRLAYKDKAALASMPIGPLWTRAPAHGTSSQLKAARREAQRPHISCDVDGDGAVGPTDYFISKHFGQERDNRLSTAERKQVVSALESGWLDKYSFGHEQAGVRRPFPVKQARGRILTVDNLDELCEVYPPHWNNATDPRFKTASDLQFHRKATLRNEAHALKEQWDRLHPSMVEEPERCAEGHVANPRFASARERAETRSRSAREDAGLNAECCPLNPDRDNLKPGLGRREDPPCNTRTALRETRRAQQVEDLQETRARAEQHFIPSLARHTQLDAQDYEWRRAELEAMTLSKLKQRRRCEFVEYNMANFGVPVKEHARHSDQEKPWWTLREGYMIDPPRCLLKEMRTLPEELTDKVNRASLTIDGQTHQLDSINDAAPAGQRSQLDVASRNLPMPHSELGQNTIKRWTSEFVPVGRVVPRLFDKLDGVVDGVKQAPLYSQDSVPFQQFSSFEMIRNKVGTQDHASEHAPRAPHAPYSARLTSHDRPNSGTQQQTGGPPRGGAVAVPLAGMVPGTTSQASLASSRDSGRYPSASRTRPAPLLSARMVDTGARMVTSDDPPMTERLDRIVARTNASDVAPDTPPHRGGSAAVEMAPGPSRPTRTTPMHTPRALPPAPMAVRSSGFQWLDQNSIPQQHGDDISLPASMQPTPRGSSRSLAQASPARSGSRSLRVAA